MCQRGGLRIIVDARGVAVPGARNTHGEQPSVVVGVVLDHRVYAASVNASAGTARAHVVPRKVGTSIPVVYFDSGRPT
jgi:hypothetical protein